MPLLSELSAGLPHPGYFEGNEHREESIEFEPLGAAALPSISFAQISAESQAAAARQQVEVVLPQGAEAMPLHRDERTLFQMIYETLQQHGVIGTLQMGYAQLGAQDSPARLTYWLPENLRLPEGPARDALDALAPGVMTAFLAYLLDPTAASHLVTSASAVVSSAATHLYQTWQRLNGTNDQNANQQEQFTEALQQYVAFSYESCKERMREAGLQVPALHDACAFLKDK